MNSPSLTRSWSGSDAKSHLWRVALRQFQTTGNAFDEWRAEGLFVRSMGLRNACYSFAVAIHEHDARL